MSFSIRFTRSAYSDLDEAYAWIAADSPEAADRWLDAIEAGAASLRHYPRRNALAPEAKPFRADIRQLIVGNYRIIYEVVETDVVVLHIRHAARRPLRRRKPR